MTIQSRRWNLRQCGLPLAHADDVRREVFKLVARIAAQDKGKIGLPGHVTSPPVIIYFTTHREILYYPER